LNIACICDGFDGHSFSSVDASQMLSWVIVVAVTIVVIVLVVVAPVSTQPTTAVDSTAASVVFAPVPQKATAVRRVALALAIALARSFSFSITVVWIFSLLAASPATILVALDCNVATPSAAACLSRRDIVFAAITKLMRPMS
jgi:hypothetical protein